MKPARHGNKFRTDGRGGKKRRHESSAFFCFAFDRKRHFKPEVIGKQHTAPCWFALRRHCLCQEGKINKMKGLSKNGVWDFQAERDTYWRCPSRAATRPGHREGLAYAARGNRSLKIQTGAKTKLVKSGQALWPLLCITFSQLGSGEESPQCKNQRKRDTAFRAERRMRGWDR